MNNFKKENNIKLHEILMSDDVQSSINSNLDDLLRIIPELEYTMGFEHKHPHHHLDVWNHTLLALSLSKKDFDVRLSLLLHDIGKPFSFQEGEVRHFKNHAKVSVIMAKNILKRFDFDNSYIKNICYLIENHDTPITEEQINNNEELCLKLYEIQRCDALAHNPEKLEKRKYYLDQTKEKILSRRKK